MTFSAVRELLLLTLVATMGTACSRLERAERTGAQGAESPLLKTPARDTRPIDLDLAAKDPAELGRAITLPHRDSARRMGAHAFKGSHELRVSEQGKEVEVLEEETTILLDKDGRLHARYANSKDYGRELFWEAGTVWVRPRYGKFHRRAETSDEEPLQVADEIYGTLAADWELVAHSAALADGGPADGGRKVFVGLGQARPRPAEKAPQRKWRESVTVQAVEGEVVIDTTGVVRRGKLKGRVSFQRDGRPMELVFATTHEVAPGAGKVNHPPDTETVETPLTSTEQEERDELLKGLPAAAPPAAKGTR